LPRVEEVNDYQGLWQERWGYLLGARQVRTVIREKTASERAQLRALTRQIRSLEDKIFEGKADAKMVRELVSLRKTRKTVLTQAHEKVKGEREQLGYILQALRAVDQRAFEALKADGVEVKPIIPSPPATAPSAEEGSGA
jgi:ribosomal protein S15P/S13E